MPTKKTRKRERLGVEERRAQLVALGLDRFGARPYDEVSVDEIAEAAGVSKGLVYHYFPSKKDYYAATVREGARRLVERTALAPEAFARGEAAPQELLERGLEAYLAYVLAHGRAYAALLRSGVGVDPEIGRIVEETRATFLARLTVGLEAAGVAMPAGAHAHMRRVALQGWVGFVEAASLAWLDGEDDARVALPELARLLARVLLGVVSAAEP